MKLAIALLVLGIVTYGVYSFTNKPNYDLVGQLDQSSMHAKLRSTDIFPKTAYANNSLTVKMHGGSPEDHSYLDVRWFRNGSEIPNEATPQLSAKHVKKGDMIHAEVNLLGPDALPEPVVTDKVKIQNSPPRIITASTSLKSLDGDVLYARVDATDPDKDRLRFTYKWFRNGSEIPNATEPTLPVVAFNKGDKFYASIVAFDGEDETAAYKCDEIEIGSNAPMITSQPPAAFTPDRRYVYQVVVESASEELMYELIRGPDGMKISASGMIDWELPSAEAGARSFDVAIRVADGTGGEVFQEFSLTLSAAAGH